MYKRQLLDNEEVKNKHLAVERNLETLHDALEKVFHLPKDSSTDIGKLCIDITTIKKEGTSTVIA